MRTEQYRYFKDADGTRWKMPANGDPGWISIGNGWKSAISVIYCSHPINLSDDGTVETDVHGEPIKNDIPAGDEVAQLRAIFPKILAALGNGACCTTDVSLGFLQEVPGEVETVVKSLRSQVIRPIDADLDDPKRLPPMTDEQMRREIHNLRRTCAQDRTEIRALRARLKAWEDAFGHLVKSDWFREPEEDPEHGIIVVDTHAPTARKALAYLTTPAAPQP